MKFARVFLKAPYGGQWCDFPLPSNYTLGQFWAQARIESCFVSPGCIVPVDTISHLMQVEMTDGQPNLVTFPGGKPN